MKSILALLILTAAFGCSKSNVTPQPDTTSAAATVTVQSAAVIKNGSANQLDMNLTFKNSSTISKCTLILYDSSSALSADHRYDIAIKDGSQDVLCSDYGKLNPVTYQIEYQTADGKTVYTALLSESY